VVYAVVFGGIGAHPLAILVVQVVLVATAAVLIDELLRKLGVDDRLSWATAALWVVIPNHTSLLLWPTAVAITVSLVLLLLGGVALAEERDAPAACILAAAVLTYEATGPAALALVVAIPLLQRRTDWRRPVAMGLAALVPAGLWVALHVPSVKEAGLARWADLRLVAPAHLGWGVFPDGPVTTVVGLAALLLVALAVRRRDPLVIAGLVVIVVGTLPFVRYFYEPLGAGDRVNVVAGVGTAMVWAGLLAFLAAHAPRPVAIAAAGCVVAAMGVASWQRSMAWADAADDADRILASLPPAHFEETITIDRPPVRHNVTAFASHSNVESAVQLERDRRDGVTARLRPGR
jgi:hypothetical protein